MSAFSPVDAALEGFRITRERPLALLAWAALQFLVGLAMNQALLALFPEQLRQFEAMSASPPPDPAQALPVLLQVLPIYAATIPVGLFLWAIFAAAVFRAVLTPADARTFYMRAGIDEARLIGLSLIYTFLAILAMFVVVFVAGLATALLRASAGPLAAALSGLVLLGAFSVMIVTAVRLSLAGPITFTERHLRVFESWNMTKGRFLPLLGAYAMAIALSVIVLVLVGTIMIVVVGMIGGADFADPASLSRALSPEALSPTSPAGMVLAALAVLVRVMVYTILLAPAAVAYRALSNKGQEDTFA